MATVDREDEVASDPGGLSARLSSAPFVRIVTRPDGDGVAAAGILARSLRARGVPFQVSTARTAARRRRRLTATEDAVAVLVGHGPVPEAATGLPAVGDGPVSLSVRAWHVARRVLDDAVAAPETTDAVGHLAVAGAVAAGHHPGAAGTAAILDGLDVERRPGVATPTTPTDGLAHSTLVHGPFSGSPDRVRETLAAADLDPDDETGARELASAVTLSTLGHEAATSAAADAVERVLRPHVGGPLSTVAGHADVLDGAARESPGTAVALVLGHDAREPALAAWRDHGRRAHEAVRDASTGRYDGLLAVRADEGAPVETVARLVAGYRSPEPVVAVVAGDRAAAAVRPDADAPAGGLGRPVRAAVERATGDVHADTDADADADAAVGVDDSRRSAVACLPPDTETTAFVACLREALQ